MEAIIQDTSHLINAGNDVALQMLAAERLPFWCNQAKLRYAFLFDELSPSNNVIKEMHYLAYRKLRQEWAMRVFVALNGRRPKESLNKVAVVAIRTSAGHLDWDNCYGGMKPIFDCLVQQTKKNPSGLGLIEDDNPNSMPYPPFILQRPGKQGKGSTAVFIFELDSLADPVY